ncbi:MAG: oligosaccharide flippase family protein [Bryobacterales bacterium]|nr:oligosaccharide flippase family protein [Bryobacterales bacterium]
MLQGSGLYSVSIVVARLLSVVLLPIYTRYLTPSDYGTLELLDQVGSIVGILFGYNFSSSLGYFYFQKEDSDSRRLCTATAVLSSAAIGLLVGTLGYLASRSLSRLVFGDESAVLYLKIHLTGMGLGFLLEALMVWLRVEDRPSVFLAAALTRTLLTAATVVPLLILWQLRVTGVMIGNFTAAAVVVVALAVFFLRRIPLRFDFPLSMRMLRFALPLIAGTGAQFILNFADRFFIQKYQSTADVGLYGLAYKIGMLILMVYVPFHTYWSAQVYSILRRDDGFKIFARTFTYMVLVLSFAALGLLVAARPGIRVLTTPAYAAATAIVPIIVAAYYVRSISDFFRCLFLVANRTSLDALCNWAGAAVCLAAYALLIPRYGIWGAAFATLISFLLVAVIAVVWVRRLQPFWVETIRLVKIEAVFAALLVLYYLVPVSSLAGQISWGLLILCGFPILLWMLRFLSPKEEQAVRSALARWRGKYNEGSVTPA